MGGITVTLADLVPLASRTDKVVLPVASAVTTILLSTNFAEATPGFELLKLGVPLMLVTLMALLPPVNSVSDVGDKVAAWAAIARNGAIRIVSQLNFLDGFMFFLAKCERFISTTDLGVAL
jgi:hypothetical protein